VLVAGREHNRRLYDLPERVLPAPVLATPEPAAATTARWLVIAKLRQRRLAMLKRDELPLVEDLVQPVKIEGCALLYCLREDVELFGRVASDNQPERDPLLLAPLDPLIYDRRVTQQLWGFDYTWEVYTPAAKRVRGYYALPILAGHELVGHVDLKADRQARKVRIVSRRVGRGHRIAPAVRTLGEFLRLKSG
jgi:uncharacterized protein